MFPSPACESKFGVFKINGERHIIFCLFNLDTNLEDGAGNACRLFGFYSIIFFFQKFLSHFDF